jgi:putative tryptophan/tyrosine transport system substrate-binding protein
MVGVADPVEAGFTASLARPGANITGTAGLGAERGGKIIELIREALPSARRVAVLANPVSLFTKPFLSHIELAARAVDIELQPLMLRPGEEFDAAFAEMRRKRADAVLIQASLTRKEAVDLALKHQVRFRRAACVDGHVRCCSRNRERRPNSKERAYFHPGPAYPRSQLGPHRDHQNP